MANSPEDHRTECSLPLSVLKIEAQSCIVQEQTNLYSSFPPTSEDRKEYENWCKLKVQNHELVSQTHVLLHQCQNLKSQLQQYEKQFSSASNPNESHKAKRRRRAAKQIERHFLCSFCSKAYGSEGSLNQHLKLKHETGETTGNAT